MTAIETRKPGNPASESLPPERNLKMTKTTRMQMRKNPGTPEKPFVIISGVAGYGIKPGLQTSLLQLLEQMEGRPQSKEQS